MHKIQSYPITMDSFETDDMIDWTTIEFSDGLLGNNWSQDDCASTIEDFISWLNALRVEYNKTKDKRIWKELIRWTPESWLQTRTVTMNYENLLAICSKSQRRPHKLNEWSGIDDNTLDNFIAWARTLPYAQEFIFIDELETPKEKLEKALNILGVKAKIKGVYRSTKEILEDIAKSLLKLSD